MASSERSERRIKCVCVCLRVMEANIERAGIKWHCECRTVSGEDNVFSHCNLILHQTLQSESLFMWYTHKSNIKILTEGFTPS